MRKFYSKIKSFLTDDSRKIKKNDFNQSDKWQNGKQNNYFKDIQPTIAVTPVNQFAK